jgi:ABC-type dipeptide/oligopeptide/nickel transport system permease subunit
MINQARRDIKLNFAQVFWPALTLSVTVLSLNQVGDWFQRRGAIRDAAL